MNTKPSSSSRYSSYNSRSSTSSHFSDPSSSSEFNHKSVVKAKAKPSPSPTFTTMMKKLVDKKPKSEKQARLIIPPDFMKKDPKRVNGLSALLFGKGSASEKKPLPLTEVKGNTRTLAMVLRSERELLASNKDQQERISHLQLLLQDKNQEVERLKDLCLKQREEIKSLKSAILFPDVMNEQQGSDSEAKQVIPTLQQQVSSLTGQLQTLARDLAEVKAVNYSAKASLQGYAASPTTPTHAPQQASNSWEFSSDDDLSDDLLLKDLNPCLTPCNAKSRSREFESIASGSLRDESLSEDEAKVYPEMEFSCYDRKFSRSSDCCQNSSKRSLTTKAGWRSDESKTTYGGRMNHKLA